MEDAPPGTERLCNQHTPSQHRRGQLKYWFFKAVTHGCQECVKILVQDMGVDKNETSDTQGYNAMGFAEYFEQHAMKDFLQTLWLFSATCPV